jgi:hypothetical protein
MIISYLKRWKVIWYFDLCTFYKYLIKIPCNYFGLKNRKKLLLNETKYTYAFYKDSRTS